MKIRASGIVLIIAGVVLLYGGCQQNEGAAETKAATEHGDHAGHDHGAHGDHEGHDHGAHGDHEGHDHGAHDHGDHDGHAH